LPPVCDGSGDCPQTLKAFLDFYTAHRCDVKPGTHLVYRRTVTCLVQFFGPDRKLSSITDAEAWRAWLATQGNQRNKARDDMADNTVRRRTGIVRQFFGFAVRKKLISENPFAGLSAQVHGNPKRQRFVTRAEIQTALDACDCPDLRAVIALSRFAGLRVPSEVIRLTWADVDLEAGRLTIHAAKTEHHADGGIRFCPIFPELRPILEALCDRANPGIDCPMSTPVIRRWQSAVKNLRTAFTRLLTKAGIAPWPKLFHNMRASRQTELLGQFPAADVCAWLGNTQAVAMKHYAMPTSDSFLRAVCGSAGGSISGSISGSQDFSADSENSETPQKSQGFETSEGFLMAESLGDTGFEPVTSTV